MAAGGVAAQSLREGPGGKEQVWEEGWGRQSPRQTDQITGHSGYFLELRVPGRRRQGKPKSVHSHCSTCSCPSGGLQPRRRAEAWSPTEPDDSTFLVGFQGGGAEGEGRRKRRPFTHLRAWGSGSSPTGVTAAMWTG